MNVLTDDEIDTITDKQWDGREIAAAPSAVDCPVIGLEGDAT